LGLQPDLQLSLVLRKAQLCAWLFYAAGKLER
jgi:hypothetical protein